MELLEFESLQRAHPVFARFLTSSSAASPSVSRPPPPSATVTASSSPNAGSSSSFSSSISPDEECRGIGYLVLPEDLRSGVERHAPATLTKRIPSHNKGFQLLRKMGWQEDSGLGKHEQGRREPVPLLENMGTLGVGQREEYETTSTLATEKRKRLEVELEETDDLKVGGLLSIGCVCVCVCMCVCVWWVERRCSYGELFLFVF
jgi:G-patch domain